MPIFYRHCFLQPFCFFQAQILPSSVSPWFGNPQSFGPALPPLRNGAHLSKKKLFFHLKTKSKKTQNCKNTTGRTPDPPEHHRQNKKHKERKFRIFCKKPKWNINAQKRKKKIQKAVNSYPPFIIRPQNKKNKKKRRNKKAKNPLQ